MVKVGVLLSGCGVQDGSEVHEAVLTLLALDQAGAEVVCMAPNKPQSRVMDHRTGKPLNETRNVLVESARIARGKISDVAKVTADELDAVIMPGGFGAALNLCDFATEGEKCHVDLDVEELLCAMHQAGKPIGAICISPVIVARLLGEEGAKVTIGTDAGTASAIEKMGAKHVACAVTESCVDEKNRIVTTPAYMLAGSIKELQPGINKLVGQVLEMAQARR